MHDSSRSESLIETTDPRLFLRTTLARLEGQHRKWALRGLADWERIEIVAQSLFGAVAYLAPEQLAQRSVSEEWGEAGDIYSLCATYSELFTGRKIFDHDRETQAALTIRKLNEPHPEPPRMTIADLSWEIKTILLGGLQREPADRYCSMADLERDLQHVLRQEPIEYRRPTLKRRFQLWGKRSPALARLVTTVAVLLVLIVVGAVVSAAVYQDLAWRESQAKDLAQIRGELAEQRRRWESNPLRSDQPAVGARSRLPCRLAPASLSDKLCIL